MRLINLGLALSALLFSQSYVPDAFARETDKEKAVSVVDAFHAALSKGDSLAALKYLADDAMVLESGHVENLEEYKSHHLGADIAFAGAVQSTRNVLHTVVEGDVAWVLSSSEVTGEFRGHSVNSLGAELIVLSRLEGGWRIRAIHWSSRRKPETD